MLRALHSHLPAEGTVYLGDTARVPYGTRSPQVVRRYALNNARFLLREAGAKLLVVACNTVSAVALPDLEGQVEVPVVGVVEPGARLAAETTKTGQVAIIGTRATVSSGAYQRAVATFDPAIRITARSCPLFVPLAEEGWTDGPIARSVAESYLGDLRGKVDTLVLGCTHYPLLHETIAGVMGESVKLVDSGRAVAEEVRRRLEEMGLEGMGEPPVDRRIFVTDVPDGFADLARRFLGGDAPEPQQVDIPT